MTDKKLSALGIFNKLKVNNWDDDHLFDILFDVILPIQRSCDIVELLNVITGPGEHINYELRKKIQMINDVQNFNDKNCSALEYVFKNGPIAKSSIPSLYWPSLNELYAKEMVVKVVVQGKSGFYVCDEIGSKAYSLMNHLRL